MKIAIRGHESRGNEVIQILESLGGKNKWFHRGINEDSFYELHDDCIWCATTRSEYFKYYTLEEFEKEFPFKIGDEVTIIGLPDYPKVITKMTWMDNEIFYTFGDNTWYNTGALRKLEMKEERNITLTLDKAKEWYKKGGELKEIALQAFTEEELTKLDLPKTWEEFCEKYPIKSGESFIDGNSKFIINNFGTRHFLRDKNICPSQKSAEAHLAMMQLEQLRNCWWGGWEPEWSNCEKYIIKWDKNDLIVFTARNIRAFLVFPTREMAYEFLKCFKDLIEKAGDLI